MPLPFQVDSIDSVEESQRALYEEKDGAYVLAVEGLPEVKKVVPDDYEALQTSVKKLEANNQALMKEKIEKAKLAEKAALEAAKAGGDIEAVEKSWQEKYSKLEAESSNVSTSYQTMINDLTVGAASSSIASEISIPGSAEVLEPHIKRRLSVEINDNKPSIRVLDANGKPSAMTLKELAEEFKNIPSFAPIIIGSKASGAGGSSAGDGGSSAVKISLSKFNSLSPSEQAEFAKNGGEII